MLARVLLCMVVVFCLLAVVTLTEVVVGLVELYLRLQMVVDQDL